MKRTQKFIAAAMSVLFMLLIPLQTVHAAETSSGLSVSPRKNFTIEPGKEVKDKLIIGNLNRTSPLIVNLRIVDFTFSDESGTPKLFLAKDAPQTSWSLKPFMNLPQSVEVPAGSSKTVEYSIKVPSKQGAGSYYSAIQYVATGTEGGNVNLSASGVTLAFMSVPGIVKEEMTLQKFGAFQRDSEASTSGKYIKIAVNESPSIVAFTLKNNGNVAESPAGSMVVKDMFGRTYKTIENVNTSGSLALIEQARRFEACLNPLQRKVDLNGSSSSAYTCGKTKLWPGRYTASLQAYYGQNGNQTHEITGVTSFWYLPLWFLIAVGVLLLVVAFVVWRIVRKLKGTDKIKKTSFRKK